MHEYYQKKRDALKKTLHGFLALVGPELEKAGGKLWAAAIEDIWEIYDRDMLARFPYIGGDDVGGTKNLTEAYMLVAMGEYLKGYGLPMEEIGHLMTLAYERRMLKMPRFIRTLMGKLLKTPPAAAPGVLEKGRAKCSQCREKSQQLRDKDPGPAGERVRFQLPQPGVPSGKLRPQLWLRGVYAVSLQSGLCAFWHGGGTSVSGAHLL